MELKSRTPWEKMELIRNKNRPTLRDYIPMIFDNFIEFHGDRHYGDDNAILGGIATLNGVPVTVIGEVRGKNLNENKKVNFGMPHPEGYRKALRLAKQAEKFNRPVIFFIDTPGAFCGIGAEERGQGEAIAKNLEELMVLRTPIISIVLGEGESGGALAIGVCDELAMLENALYSVVSPTAFASILWKDNSKEKEATAIMHITAQDLKELGVCETIIPEPVGGAHTDLYKISENIKEYLVKKTDEKMKKSLDVLLNERYTKFRKIGEFEE